MEPPDPIPPSHQEYTRSVELVLPLPPVCLSPNARAHWRKKAGAIAAYRALAGRVAEPLRPHEPWRSAIVSSSWRFHARRKRDPDNLAAMLKPAIDGCRDARILVDDDLLKYHTPKIIAGVPAAEEGVTLTLKRRHPGRIFTPTWAARQIGRRVEVLVGGGQWERAHDALEDAKLDQASREAAAALTLLDETGLSPRFADLLAQRGYYTLGEAMGAGKAELCRAVGRGNYEDLVEEMVGAEQALNLSLKPPKVVDCGDESA